MRSTAEGLCFPQLHFSASYQVTVQPEHELWDQLTADGCVLSLDLSVYVGDKRTELLMLEINPK